MPITSPFGRLYLDLIRRINTKVPEIRYIDQDFGQLEQYVKRPGVAFPAVFIDFQNWQYDDYTQNEQKAKGDVIVQLALSKHSSSSSLTPEQWREIPLEYYEIEQKLFKALHGYCPVDEDQFGYLTRTAVRGQNTPKLRRRPLTFRLEFIDREAAEEIRWETKPPALISKTIVETE